MAISSGQITSAAAYTYVNPCFIMDVALIGGSDAATITIRDGGASGTIKWDGKVAASTTMPQKEFPEGLRIFTSGANSGLYVAVTGTGAVGYVTLR